MSHLVHFTSCPVCNSQSVKEVFSATDYTVSKEQFLIVECKDCTLRFTQNTPCETAMQKYYESFDYISHSDSRKGIINKLYHFARKFTMVSKMNMVKEATGRPVGMLLDVGSGTGTFVHTMEEAGWSVIGFEPDANARAYALKQYNCDIYAEDELFNLHESTYSAITMWHVLEHIHRLDEYLVQLKKLLVPDGKLIIALPNYTSKDAEIYQAGWASYDVPRHLYHFSPASFKKLMEKHGLKIVDTKPLWLDSYYISMLSEKYKNGSLLKGVWNGLRSNIHAFRKIENCSSLVYIVGKVDENIQD